jgi:hypothetical protein
LGVGVGGEKPIKIKNKKIARLPRFAPQRKLRKLDQKLYGTDIDSASPPGPLLRRFHALGEVHPIVFGAYGEVRGQ